MPKFNISIKLAGVVLAAIVLGGCDMNGEFSAPSIMSNTQSSVETPVTSVEDSRKGGH